MIMNDQQQLAIICNNCLFHHSTSFFIDSCTSKPKGGSNGSGESRSKCGRVLLHFDFLSATKNVLHCVVSRRKPTLEDCPWATPILRKVIWDVKGAMCKVWQPRAIFNKFWRHKASSFEVLLPWTESGFCKHILVKSDSIARDCLCK